MAVLRAQAAQPIAEQPPAVIPARAQEDESDEDPEEFRSIDMEDFRVDVTTWKR